MSQTTILTLANRVLETSDAVNELSVLLQTRLSTRQRRDERHDEVMPNKLLHKSMNDDKHKMDGVCVCVCVVPRSSGSGMSPAGSPGRGSV